MGSLALGREQSSPCPIVPGVNLDPDYRPDLVLRTFDGTGEAFRLGDALTGAVVFGATGSGKTSGPAKHIAYGYLAHGFGGLVLCAKADERKRWQQWAEDTGRLSDLVVIDGSGKQRFNFMDWEVSRAGVGAGLTINVVSLLDELAGAVAGRASDSGSGDNRFFSDALHHMNINLVDLPIFAGLVVALPLLRDLVSSAPRSLAEAASPEWNERSVCARVLREAAAAVLTADADTKNDFEECRKYWTLDFPALSEKTRSIITLSFAMLVQPFVTRPLRRLFSTDTTIKPEDAFTGKIIIVDLPVQEYRLAGRIANLAWKYCFQVAVLRRSDPMQTGVRHRPVFLWADEAQNFVTEFDSEYQAVARSAGGCTVYLTQNRESLRRVLGNDDTTDSLLGNLQAKFFCQNAGETNEWASKLFGERWMTARTLSSNRQAAGEAPSTGISFTDQHRRFIEASEFTTLKRGGETHGKQVEAILYNGGRLFAVPGSNAVQPFVKITFNQ
jgi:TraM recognition site of TraD and TraG